MRDLGPEANYISFPTAPATFEPSTQFVNYHAFLARMESMGVWYRDPTHGIWTMRDEFEDP
jgi:hypothetical protein